MAAKKNPTPSNLHKGLQEAAKRRVENSQKNLRDQFDAGVTFQPINKKNVK